jgi:hypothetical protein
MEAVLCDYVCKEDLSVKEAVQATINMLFENSNKLYCLGLKLPEMSALSLQAPVGTTDKVAAIIPHHHSL